MNKLKRLKTKSKPKIHPKLLKDSNSNRSWEMSHLPVLNPDEAAMLIDLLNCWFEKRKWIITDGCNISLMWEYAERHGYSGTIGSLSLSGLLKNEPLAKRGQQRYISNMLYHDQCMAICVKLKKAAIYLKIPLSFIKGTALSLYAYKDHGIRSYSDIDVLVESRQDAWKLIRELNLECREEEEESCFLDRLNETGRVHAKTDDWTIEFCYPIRRPCDPMFDIITRFHEQIFKIPESGETLPVPEPEIHFLLLIQHMARHLCTRFIWFLDLSVFYRTYQQQIDFDWLKKELKKLGLKEAASRIFSFCRNYIHQDFPVVVSGETGWNDQFLNAMTSPSHILNQISLFHTSGWRKNFSYILSPSRFFLISDPGKDTQSNDPVPARWLSSRLCHAFQVNNDTIYKMMVKLLSVTGYPLCRFILYIIIRGNSVDLYSKSIERQRKARHVSIQES